MPGHTTSARYGIGELYGLDFSSLPPSKVRALAIADHRKTPCPFRPMVGKARPSCSKKGGACSLREYALKRPDEVVPLGPPVTTCPRRFLEGDLVKAWVGETILGTRQPIALSEIPFLMSADDGTEENAEVGQIDTVLVGSVQEPFQWCALEMQAVYFSGASMENDLHVMRKWRGPGTPFPPAHRRPDFRSSGPKRLMPQLQVKVPTISRWGKKMAVVIDKAFWDSLGKMREARDVSNSDIAWFVVNYISGKGGVFNLTKHSVHYTTLDQAVEGLTGGTPMSLARFEGVIRDRLQRLSTS